MRILSVAIATLFASLSFSQSAIELQKKALESIPAVSFDELKRCAKPGEPASTATTKFGDPTSGKAGRTFSGTHTMSFSWPAPGIFRESHIALDGLKYAVFSDQGIEREINSFDGKKSYSLLEGPSRKQIHINGGMPGSERPFIVHELNLSDLKFLNFRESGTGTDTKFGRTIHFDGDRSSFADIAPDFDYMTIHTKFSGQETWVQEAIQYKGHWIPTLIKTSSTFRDPVDVYATIKNIQPLLEADKKFTPKYTVGTLVVDNNVYYDVTKDGKLVKSKMQPDRTSQYLSWAGMSAVLLLVLSVVVIGCYKLFRRQPA